MSLTGKSATAYHMSGVSCSTAAYRSLMNHFILPFQRQDWNTLQQNTFLLPSMKKQLRRHASLYPYLDFLQALTWIRTDAVQGVQLVYRTQPLHILPEYEVYRTFYGKTDYESSKLSQIRHLVQDTTLDYQGIESILRNNK